MSGSYTDALLDLSTKIGVLAGCAGRQEEILLAVSEINGYVREHGEVLAAHQQWIESHQDKHVARDRDFRALSSRVWTISGGSGLLAIAATVLQFLNL